MKTKRFLTTMFIVLATIALAIPTTLFATLEAASVSLIGPEITVTTVPTTGELGESVFIPVPSTTGTVISNDDDKTYTDDHNIYSVLITRAKEGIIIPSLTSKEGVLGWTFTANYTGIYTFKYVATMTGDETMSTTSPSYNISITGPETNISLPTNSPYIVPSVLPQGVAVKFPVAVVTTDDETGTRTAYLTRNGVRVHTFTDEDVQTDNSGFKYYSAYTMSITGTYTLTYQYQIGSSEPTTIPPTTYTVKSNYDISDLELTLSISNTPSTATLGVEQTIPTPTVVDGDGNAVNCYIEIEVYKIIDNTDSTLVTGAIDGYSFTAPESGDYRIYYTAIATYGDTTVESSRKSFKIMDVSDTVAPTSYAVNEYEMGDTGLSIDGITAVKFNGTMTSIHDIFLNKTGVDYTEETFAELSTSYKRTILMVALEDLSYAIPSTATVDEEITIPAIYATDNYSVFGDSDNGIEVVRQIKLEGSDTVQPISTASGSVATYTFTTAGTHTIRYYAVDRNFKNNSEVELASYTIIVTEDGPSASTPEITMPTIPASVEKTDAISFTMEDATDVNDERVEMHAYWSFTNDFSNLSTVNELKADEDGNYVIDLSDYEETAMGNGAVYLYFTATNDLGTMATDTDDIQINNVGVNKDEIAPTIKTNQNGYMNAFKGVNGIDPAGELDFPQGTQIQLPFYIIADDKGASVNVMVTDEYGNIVRVKNSASKATSGTGETLYTISTDSTEATANHAYFVASSGGYHYITYYAKDSGNNIVVKTFRVNVTMDNATIDYIKTGSLPTTIEKGVYYELPNLVAMNGTEEIDTTTHTINLYWEVSTSIQLDYDYDGAKLIGFTALETTGDGEYITFVAHGTIDAGETTEVVLTPKTYRRTTVTDTIKPILIAETNYALPDQVDYTSGMEIFLPNYEAEDKNSDGDVVETINNITVTAKCGSTTAEVTTVTEDLYARDGGSSGINITRYKFTPSKNGEWTITYSATDESGLTSTKSLAIKVGDCDAPELTWTNRSEDLITEAIVGDSYTLSLDFFTITDEDTEDMTYEEYLSYISDSGYANIYLSDPDSATVTNELADATTTGYEWSFDKAGTYTLYFKLTDETGNTKTYSYEITVTSPASGTQEDKSDVLGIVLITVACTITAGVIGYFVYVGVKSLRGKMPKKSGSNKDDNNDKIVK